MIGSHLIKAWSATQASIALSSGEAEYYGVVRGVGIALGIQALYRDLGVELPVRTWTDSTAAIGIGGRQGLGKLRHLECHSLWVQQRLRRREFQLLKVAGEANPADLFTKHLESRAKVDQLIALFHCKFLEGRPASAPVLKQDRGGGQAKADVNQADDDRILPHMRSPEEISKMFLRAVPEPAPLDEDDQDAGEELADPVPGIVERRRALRALHSTTGASRPTYPSTAKDSLRSMTSARREDDRGTSTTRRKRDAKLRTRANAAIVEREELAHADAHIKKSIDIVKRVGCIRIGAYEQSESRGSDSAQRGPPVVKGVMTCGHSDIWERRYSHPCHRMRSLIGSAGERPGGVFDCGMFGSS